MWAQISQRHRKLKVAPPAPIALTEPKDDSVALEYLESAGVTQFVSTATNPVVVLGEDLVAVTQKFSLEVVLRILA